MRWKLLRRRLSVSAPRMIVRSHLPWPLRWAAGAHARLLGGSALWAFEFGKEIAGLDRDAKEELAPAGRSRAVARRCATRPLVGRYGDSLIKAERVAQERWPSRCASSRPTSWRCSPTWASSSGCCPPVAKACRCAAAGRGTRPGRLRYQMLVMQNGKAAPRLQGPLRAHAGGHAGRQALDDRRPRPAQPCSEAVCPGRRRDRAPAAGRDKNGAGEGAGQPGVRCAPPRPRSESPEPRPGGQPCGSARSRSRRSAA
jgi:hypothetical protein